MSAIATFECAAGSHSEKQLILASSDRMQLASTNQIIDILPGAEAFLGFGGVNSPISNKRRIVHRQGNVDAMAKEIVIRYSQLLTPADSVSTHLYADGTEACHYSIQARRPASPS